MFEFMNKMFKDLPNLYQVLRLILPKLDKLRATYGMGETYLGRYYSKILSLPEKEDKMLKHWKNPQYQPIGCPAGDFVGVLCVILKSRTKTENTLTLNDVNNILDDLHASPTNEKHNILAKMIRDATLKEQKWICGCILKDLKLGFGHEAFLKKLDKRALDVYNSTSSLLEVCNYLKNPSDTKYATSFFQVILINLI